MNGNAKLEISTNQKNKSPCISTGALLHTPANLSTGYLLHPSLQWDTGRIRNLIVLPIGVISSLPRTSCASMVTILLSGENRQT